MHKIVKNQKKDLQTFTIATIIHSELKTKLKNLGEKKLWVKLLVSILAQQTLAYLF